MRSSPPSVAPLSSCSTSRSTSCTLGVGSDDEHWRNFDNSVSAVSFGLVATAILICMFLVMALFERFLRPPSSAAATGARSLGDLHSHHGKLEYPPTKVRVFLIFYYFFKLPIYPFNCFFFLFETLFGKYYNFYKYIL
ncbi:hypothetical protein HanHA300_Chr10g0360031 [Helianthus annuus]|nr:hypothetical protein HanHA300_Chr10g0360031 [Helianthus annuus]KAJ0529741.1 hypothetical protein HanHA89_Chr10g0381491 [Helianthus annuus]